MLSRKLQASVVHPPELTWDSQNNYLFTGTAGKKHRRNNCLAAPSRRGHLLRNLASPIHIPPRSSVTQTFARVTEERRRSVAGVSGVCQDHRPSASASPTSIAMRMRRPTDDSCSVNVLVYCSQASTFLLMKRRTVASISA